MASDLPHKAVLLPGNQSKFLLSLLIFQRFMDQYQNQLTSFIKDEKISAEEVKLKLVVRYNQYFALWKDFNALVAILAMVGVLMGMRDWA